MAGRAKPKDYKNRRRESKDSKVFRYIVSNESGKCSPGKLLQTFKEFKSEDGIIEWVEYLRKNYKRQLLEVKYTGKETLIRVHLNGVQICKKYGYAGNCGKDCNKIHFCRFLLKGFCTKKGQCQKSHNISDEHNRKILSVNNLADLDRRLVFKSLRYLSRWNKTKSEDDDPDDTQSMVSEVESVATLDDIYSDDDDEVVDEVDIFRTVLNKYGGQCRLKTLIAENPDLGTESELTDWFEDIEEGGGDDWFKIEGEVIILDLAEIKICSKYTREDSCKAEHCQKLHICKFGVLGSCRFGAKCKFYHRLKSGPNEKIIRPLEEDDLTEDDILQYLKLKFQKDDDIEDDDSDTTSVKSDISSHVMLPRHLKIDGSDVVHYILTVHYGQCKYSDLTGTEMFGFRNKTQIKDFINFGNGKERLTILPRPGGDVVSVNLAGAQICTNYKRKTSCQNDSCKKFHLCSFAVMGKCMYRRCKFDHDLNAVHNRNVLKKLHLEDLEDDDILLYLKLQLDDGKSKEVSSRESMESETKSANSRNEKASNLGQEDPKPIPSLMDAILPVDINLKRQRDVLNCLMQTPDGSCTLTNLHRKVRDEFPTTTDLLSWLTSSLGRKLCAVQQAMTPQGTLVMLYIQVFQVCFNYCSAEGCHDPRCTFFHLCREFVAGVCGNINCQFSHDTKSPHNQRVVRKADLTFESNVDLVIAIRHSIPAICVSHNTSHRCQNATCRRFHICANYLQFQCRPSVCSKGHDLKGDHNIRLIKTLGLSDKLIFKTLQVSCPSKEAQFQTYSTEPANNDSTPSIDQTEAVQCLLQQTEEVLVEKLTTVDAFNQYTPKEILNWLTSPEGEEICIVYPAKSPGKHAVKLCVKHLQLCFGHQGKQGCQKENCGFLHLCREKIAGYCERRNCKYSHDVRDDHNIKILWKTRLGLECFSYEDVYELIIRSTPQVCLDHNSATRCRKPVCMKFHICANKVRHRCSSSEDACPKGHTFRTEHNKKLLDVYDKPENVVHMMLIVKAAKEEESLTEKRPKRMSETQPTTQKNEQESRIRTLCSGSFLEKMLSKYDGYCPLQKFTEICPTGVTLANVLVLLTAPAIQKYYSTFVPTSGYTSMILAKVKDVDLCYHYFGTQGCNRNKCSYLHLCREHLAGNCTKKTQCKFSHNIEDRQNAKVLTDANVPKGISECHLLKLVQNCIPCVCREHNSAQGCTDEFCHKFHVCSNYIRRSCTRSAIECVYDHSFETTHNLKLMELYNCTKDNIKARVIAADQPRPTTLSYTEHSDTSSRNPVGRIGATSDGKVAAGNQYNTMPRMLLSDADKAPSIPICHKFITKSCRNPHCNMHHHNMPYLWCITKHGAWKPLGAKTSEGIEELYSRPEKRVFKIKFEDTTLTVDLSNIDFAAKVSNQHANIFKVTQPCGHYFERVCRLSTKSYVELDDGKYATVWQWYWKDESMGWMPYGLDNDFPYQDVIEAKFISKTEEMIFEKGEYTYMMNLTEGPNDKFCQVNTKIGTKRDVRRRPMFISESEVIRGQFSFPEKKYQRSDLPRGWFPMDTSSKGYDLIPQQTTSKHYRDVERRFRETMPLDDYDILEIFRVQNLQLWKKYTGHKEDLEKFEGAALEKQLFHATDNETTVKGICYQNFDPRLHGKNATAYGKGAYFARCASYSNRYAAQRGIRYMFLADVLVGKYTKGDSSMRRPPPLPVHAQSTNKQHDLYDSTVDDVLNPQIYVIYANEKCYPTYLIMYREWGEPVTWKTFKQSNTAALTKTDHLFQDLSSDMGLRTVTPQSTVKRPAPVAPRRPIPQPVVASLQQATHSAATGSRVSTSARTNPSSLDLTPWVFVSKTGASSGQRTNATTAPGASTFPSNTAAPPRPSYPPQIVRSSQSTHISSSGANIHSTPQTRYAYSAPSTPSSPGRPPKEKSCIVQ